MEGLIHKVQLHQKLSAKGLEIISLNMEGEEELENVTATLKKHNITLTNFCLVGADSDENLAALETDGLLPVIHIYGRDGVLRFKGNGYDDVEEMNRELEATLAAK